MNGRSATFAGTGDDHLNELADGITTSVVVPVFCEEQGIREFHERLSAVLDGNSGVGRWEIVYVDDGSTDTTAEILQQFAGADDRVRFLRFSRNFGHQAAITAGMEHARGRCMIVIDSDLQDPPEVIPAMIKKWKEGFEVVYGQRESRAGETVFKKWTAALFYRLIDSLSDVHLPPDVGDFRLIDRKVADALRVMPERSRYVRGMIAWVGFNQYALPYARDERFAGETKYPLRKMIHFAVDATTSFSDKPLRVATRIGAFLIALSLLFTIWLLVNHFILPNTSTVPGWASLMAGITVFGGVQLLTIGVLGEYIGRIYKEVQQRPIYIVSDDSSCDK